MALRNKRVKVVEYLDGEVQLWRDGQLLPLKAFERHQHLANTRVTDDKMLNVRVDIAVKKEADRLRNLASRVQRENAKRRTPTSLSAWPRP